MPENLTNSVFASIAGGLLPAWDAIPVVPGKIIPVSLLLLSIIAWSVIFTKLILLHRIRKADREFVRRLKRSQTCFDVLEEGKDYAPSALFEVYLSGARSALRLLFDHQNRLGIPRGEKSSFASALSPGDVIAIDGGFVIGERRVIRKFQSGFQFLGILSLLVPLLGQVAAIWLIVLALNVDGLSFNFLSTHALILILVSLLVTLPIGVFRMVLRRLYQNRVRRVSQFSTQITRIFRQEMAVDPAPRAPSQDLSSRDGHLLPYQ